MLYVVNVQLTCILHIRTAQRSNRLKVYQLLNMASICTLDQVEGCRLLRQLAIARPYRSVLLVRALLEVNAQLCAPRAHGRDGCLYTIEVSVGDK